jgi:hypothetical protein
MRFSGEIFDGSTPKRVLSLDSKSDINFNIQRKVYTQREFVKRKKHLLFA